MTLSSLLLILFSACIHVVAHVALKRATNRTALIWWMLLWGGLIFSPVLVFDWHPISLQVWGIMALSAVFGALYFYAIAKAYAAGDDISIIYPLARGTAPMLLLAWSALYLREQPNAGGALGVVAIAAGLYLVNLPRIGAWREPLRALSHTGPRWALLAGLCISLYTVIDRVGVTLLDPLLYTYIVLWIAWVFLTPFAFREVGWNILKSELRANWISSLIAGFTNTAAYVIVLYVMQSGTRASYAGATREISVVLGVIVGVMFFKEKGTVMKLAGAACVAAGVVMIKLLG
ncbi:MAG: EamA family transporter [Chloroflexota bacterium]